MAEKTSPTYDLAIIGGGINGAAIARDAAGRGLKALLLENGDLAGGTSSASSKLVHGGLRYLEHLEFRLVREALLERETLLTTAPHIIWPLRIVLPHDKGLRPAWMLRLGLFLYDWLGTRKILPGAETVKLNRPPYAGILKQRLVKGFAFSDCWTDDARMVVLNALDAAERGADIKVRTRCTGLVRQGAHWMIDTEGEAGPQRYQARAVVNAAGIAVDDIWNSAFPGSDRQNLRLVKGSHIVTRKLYDGDHLYMFQNRDKRIVFAIPYERDFTLIGTTDAPYDPAAGPPEISAEETGYLCAIASEYFARPVTQQDIVWTYSGVRPLYDDKADNASTVTRDYVFDLDAPEGAAPLLSIFGGKITTCRKLAEHALEKLAEPLGLEDGSGPEEPGWTAFRPLPGGDIAGADFDAFFTGLEQSYSWMPRDMLWRMARCYGTRIDRIIGNCDREDQLGEQFGGGLSEAEVRYLIDQEWARAAEDILWRRTKCGLHMSEKQRKDFQRWFTTYQQPRLMVGKA
ncbi:MAG: glycerol-3-phosphate dehydrogenase [Pseudomonadota bacterium]